MKDELDKDSKGSGCELLISYRDNVLPDQGYRWVWSNGGMVSIRGNVIMYCLIRAID